jgi:predicted dehydrogenase
VDEHGIGIVGTGNIATGYARDIGTHRGIRLVAATDLDPDRASAFAAEHAIVHHAQLDDLLADPAVDIVANLTVHQAHFDVTRRALQAGKHVYSEKPMALRGVDARELIRIADANGVRLACSPSTFLGEAQQTATAWVRSGRLGQIRVVYADVDWGRIESWHPAPRPFYDVGVLVDVGVYPLTLVTSMLGPARRVRAWGWRVHPERLGQDGTPFTIGRPDQIVVGLELEGGVVVRLTASFYVGRPARDRGALEFHGDAASLHLGDFQQFDAAVEVGPYDGAYEPVELVRPPFRGIAWARGMADLAESIDAGRPQRASAEQAAHVVDILDAAEVSMTGDGAPIELRSSFDPPEPLPWARLDSPR